MTASCENPPQLISVAVRSVSEYVSTQRLSVTALSTGDVTGTGAIAAVAQDKSTTSHSADATVSFHEKESKMACKNGYHWCDDAATPTRRPCTQCCLDMQSKISDLERELDREERVDAMIAIIKSREASSDEKIAAADTISAEFTPTEELTSDLEPDPGDRVKNHDGYGVYHAGYVHDLEDKVQNINSVIAELIDSKSYSDNLRKRNRQLREVIMNIGSQEYIAPPGSHQDSIDIGVSMAAFWAMGQIQPAEGQDNSEVPTCTNQIT